MIEWRRLSTGVRPVPDPVATPVIWGGAFLGALVLVATLNFFGGHGRPMFALVALSLLAALLGLCARFVAAPGTAALCWVFLNGFAIPPAGHLSWAGDRDAGWLACLLAAAIAGTALARVVNARAGYRRITPFGHRSWPPE
ncbi:MULTISPECIES: hypothetical protein [Streptomyces]|uniref:Integral membrane protein n=2 Tax=Streptomyces TaxID=1883 RepID=A0ABT9KNJ9_9ACTN|nr:MULTISPECIES: hypothetical protein [Streptomyces]MBW8092532.1 hypothetical protein [Streptomyces hygroscopicus subsp. hygroscopicus]MDN3058752.1 hypothetical protein [Streptomyces sp. SRF1]MDP9609999.1 hypothetical protein [Streptomyces demainii]GHJ28246.1 hypothetical protein TPA0910_26790 [Streptomyces hygroscopicus]